MGLSQSSGSLTPPSLPHSNDNLVEEADPTPDMEHKLDKSLYIKDAYHNRTALNTARDSSVIDALKGFASGTPIIVTYFHNMESLATKQSTFSDLSFSSDSVNYGYQRINNFELKLQSPMDFSYDNGQVTSEVTGVALVYPGFTPKVGDMFLYQVQDGILGLFRVTGAPSRLSIRTGSSHTFPFKLILWPEEEHIIEITDRVRETSYFDKQRFLTEDAALLVSDDVKDLEFINTHRESMLTLYGESFYDNREYKSIVRPDGIYDPYLVDFVKATMELGTGRFIQQLLPKAPHYKVSFWQKLMSPKRINWAVYPASAFINTYQVPAVATRVTALVNRTYVELLTDGTGYTDVVPYISENIGNPDTISYTPFDTLIAYHMEYKVIDVDILFALIEDVYDLTPIEQCYQVPVYLYLLWILEHGIRTGNQVRLAVPDQSPYVHVEFVQPSDEIVAEVYTYFSPGSKVIALLDNNGNPVYLEPLDISYLDDSFSIQLGPMKAEQSIVGDLPGTWIVILSNNRILSL